MGCDEWRVLNERGREWGHSGVSGRRWKGDEVTICCAAGGSGTGLPPEMINKGIGGPRFTWMTHSDLAGGQSGNLIT